MSPEGDEEVDEKVPHPETLPAAVSLCSLAGRPAGCAGELAADPCSVPFPGIIWGQILEGHLEEAEHQLEFLKEVQQSLGKSEVRAP